MTALKVAPSSRAASRIIRNAEVKNQSFLLSKPHTSQSPRNSRCSLTVSYTNWSNVGRQRLFIIGVLLAQIQTLGTAACRVKPLMSESVELEAVSVMLRPESDCFSQLSVTVTPSFSYTLTVGAAENRFTTNN